MGYGKITYGRLEGAATAPQGKQILYELKSSEDIVILNNKLATVRDVFEERRILHLHPKVQVMHG